MGVLLIDGPIKVVGVFALPVNVLVRSPGTWVEFDVIRSFALRLILMICADALHRLHELMPLKPEFTQLKALCI